MNEDSEAGQVSERADTDHRSDPVAGREDPPLTPAASTGGEPGPIVGAIGRIRDDPVLLVPFLLAGALLSAIDWLRSLDPIAATTTRGLAADGLDVTLAFDVFPTPAAQTGRRMGGLVDLHLEYLAWAIGLEVLATLAVVVAGAVTLARAADRSLSTRTVASYAGFVVGVAVVLRSTEGMVAVEVEGLLGLAVGLLIILVVIYAFARLFAAPGFVVLGDTPWTALGRSVRFTAGDARTLVPVVIVVGLALWLATSIPHVGATVGGLLAAVHAVAIVAYLDRSRPIPTEDG